MEKYKFQAKSEDGLLEKALEELANSIRKEFNADCVEMEGAAIAQICCLDKVKTKESQDTAYLYCSYQQTKSLCFYIYKTSKHPYKSPNIQDG